MSGCPEALPPSQADKISSKIDYLLKKQAQEKYGTTKIRAAILSITPELLIEFLGLDAFNVRRAQYNFERNTLDFVVESELLPETEIYNTLPTIFPAYERTGECQVRLKEIHLQDGRVIKPEDIETLKKGLEV